MSGKAGSMGRMNAGIFSYIDCTPAMISVASFSSIPFPFDFDLALLVLIVLTACLVRVPKLHHITSSRIVQLSYPLFQRGLLVVRSHIVSSFTLLTLSTMLVYDSI